MKFTNLLKGCYLLNNTAIVEINPTNENNYEITLIYSSSSVRALFESGTKITKSIQEFKHLVKELDIVRIDSTKAQVIEELYG